MTATLDDLKTLAGRSLGIPVALGERLQGGGSERAFHRLTAAGASAVGVVSANLPEVRAFLGFTRHFAAQGIPVPRILGEDAQRGLYLMEDLGDRTLATALLAWRAAGQDAEAQAALERTLRLLPRIQVCGGKGLDYSLCTEGPALDGAAFRADVARFVTHYLPRFVLHPAPLNEAVQGDLDALLARLDALPRDHFCYRDFQARNVMWVQRAGEAEAGPVFLDYQSGRHGPLAYDVASLLYSPDTGIDEPRRARLIDAYLEAFAEQGEPLSKADFLAGFWPIVLVRRMQALGRYGELIAVRKQTAFLDRIGPAVADLRTLLEAGRFNFGLPALEAWLARVLGA